MTLMFCHSLLLTYPFYPRNPRFLKGIRYFTLKVVLIPRMV